jgi:hypothetical protein
MAVASQALAGPDDERQWRYQDLACARCGALVQVVKFSQAHTSVQWTREAVLTCPEFAADGQEPGHRPGLVATCAQLRASIDAAVAGGRLAVQEP